MFKLSLKTKILIVIASEERTKQSVIEKIASLHFIPFAMTGCFFFRGSRE